MLISDRTKKALETVGLTGHEIKIFTFLLREGGQNAMNLSKISEVPYSKIYDVLASLKRKGWVESDESRPTRYFARSPMVTMEITKQRMETDFADNKNVILNELLPLYEKSGTRERPDIWVLSGTLNIATKILEMVDSCRNEVMIALPEASQDLVKQALPKLRLLYDRGVKITILTADTMDRESLKAGARIARVKVRKGLFGGGIISDRRHVVILLGPEVGGSSLHETVAIWADHAGLAGFASEYFEYLLKDSEEI